MDHMVIWSSKGDIAEDLYLHCSEFGVYTPGSSLLLRQCLWLQSVLHCLHMTVQVIQYMVSQVIWQGLFSVPERMMCNKALSSACLITVYPCIAYGSICSVHFM